MQPWRLRQDTAQQARSGDAARQSQGSRGPAGLVWDPLRDRATTTQPWLKQHNARLYQDFAAAICSCGQGRQAERAPALAGRNARPIQQAFTCSRLGFMWSMRKTSFMARAPSGRSSRNQGCCLIPARDVLCSAAHREACSHEALGASSATCTRGHPPRLSRASSAVQHTLHKALRGLALRGLALKAPGLARYTEGTSPGCMSVPLQHSTEQHISKAVSIQALGPLRGQLPQRAPVAGLSMELAEAAVRVIKVTVSHCLSRCSLQAVQLSVKHWSRTAAVLSRVQPLGQTPQQESWVPTIGGVLCLFIILQICLCRMQKVCSGYRKHSGGAQ